MSVKANRPQTGIAIEARGLVKVFGDNRAVDGVDLTVPAGMIYAVLGPNGAGKTTTINMLATLVRPDGGSAKIFGHDVEKEPFIVRQLIGVTGQFASVDEKLSAMENLIIFSRLLGLSKAGAKAKALELLEEFDLAEAAKRPLEKFSGGMRRRLDLAVSLIAQPPLVFLDEPTTGLDPSARTKMWGTIRRLVASGSTILLTTQYLEEADQLADRIAVIDRGRVVAEGGPSQLKKSIGQASLHIGLHHFHDMERTRAIIRDILKVEALITDASRISARMTNPDSVADVAVELKKAGVSLASLSVQEPSLDEVFFALTGAGKNAGIKEGKEND
jgi:ABC-2 type transport system ATP-binding protein